MKRFLPVAALLSVALLTGCATQDYKMYTDTQRAIASANATAESAKYAALAEIARTGDATAKVAAVMSINFGGLNNNRNQQQILPPRSAGDIALQWTSILLPSLTQFYGINANRQVAITQSNNATALALRQSDNQVLTTTNTNNTFANIAGAGLTATTTTATAGLTAATAGLAAAVDLGKAGLTATTTTATAGLTAAVDLGNAGLTATTTTAAAGLTATTTTAAAGLTATTSAASAGLTATNTAASAGLAATNTAASAGLAAASDLAKAGLTASTTVSGQGSAASVSISKDASDAVQSIANALKDIQPNVTTTNNTSYSCPAGQTLTAGSCV
jgi:hypothetical protein